MYGFQSGDRVSTALDTRVPIRRIVSIAFTLGAVAVAMPGVSAVTSKNTPNVSVHTADGANVRLADYKGRVVLIDFWASWCPPCKTSFPALDAIYREYAEQGLEVLAVNVDERRRDADAFLDAHPHRLTVLFDPKGVAPEAFGIKGMPSSFLIDRAGTIRFTHMGYTGNMDDLYREEIGQLLSEP
jgi:thiol-disulfide isomerase/thioredoxin